MDWNKIVTEHGPGVWRTVHRIVSNHADAADCFQETFVSALDVARRQHVRNWPAMLHRLATTRALDRLRRRMRTDSRHDSPLRLDDVISPEISPVQSAQDRELAQTLRSALAHLPPGQAEVFCLRHLNELGYRDIARCTGMSVGAVGVALFRARQQLRNLLSAQFAAAGSEGVTCP
jgi:RNA polymerase sigma-70 factor (ECF subfamily)